MTELEPWKKEVNSLWLTNLKEKLKEEGVWVWRATGYKYTLRDGKFVAENTEAHEALKKILPDDDKNI